MHHSRCNLFKTLLLFWDAASQSIIFRSLGIDMLSLCTQVNYVFSLSDFDLEMSSDTLMYSRMCMVNGVL